MPPSYDDLPQLARGLIELRPLIGETMARRLASRIENNDWIPADAVEIDELADRLLGAHPR
jgi:hypothetical protein